MPFLLYQYNPQYAIYRKPFNNLYNHPMEINLLVIYIEWPW